MRKRESRLWIVFLATLLAGCAGRPGQGAAGAAAPPAVPACDPGNAGLTLPAGFCALLVADSAGSVRHLAVAPNGDILAAVRGNNGGVLLLRDTTGDGKADLRRRFGPGSGGGLYLAGGFLYFGMDDGVLRWPWTPGLMEPAVPPDTVVWGLVNRRQHAIKTFVVTPDGALLVNIGAPSNACQSPDRQPRVPGLDPCPLLDSSGGIWRFDARATRQGYTHGRRWATGLRNVVAFGRDSETGFIYGAPHGRDDLARMWPELYTAEQNAEKPSEELRHLIEGGDYGWPYCLHDPELGRMTLAPEYGGDGRTVGRCARIPEPLAAYPAHWAPNALLVYRGTRFPAEYHGGIFIAFHGSWNRAPLPQQGFNVVFQPMRDGRAAGPYRVFADGFRREGGRPSRPTGLAVGPDGSLYVSDDGNGRIYRIIYRN
jgi:glucose/arabinose dehydrogenase